MRMHGRHRHLRRLGVPQVLALAGITLVALSAAFGVGFVQGGDLETAMEPPASAPAWRTGAVACRDDPMIAVPHPTRFVVVANCSTVAGVVKQVRRDPADGELNMLIELDQSYAQFLPSAEDAVLRAAVVPRDVPKVSVPRVGEHATLYGAWVLDRNQRNQVALHPVWGVEATERRCRTDDAAHARRRVEHGSQQAADGPHEGASSDTTRWGHEHRGPGRVHR